jgi:Tfp pilus assembly protein PilX
MINHTTKTIKKQKGVALIIALVVLFLISALAVSLIFVTQSEMWASANYRLLTQSRYAAEAGAQTAVNWFKNDYTAPATTTYFDMTKSPVQCKTSGGGCPTVGSPIVLGATSNYPDTTSATQNSFNGILNGISVPGVANATYTVTAELMQMQSGGTQTWQITSVGSIAGARGATTQVVETIQSNTTPTFQYAVFATGSGCSNPVSITFSGGAYTDGYNSSSGAYGGSNINDTAGSIGTNGNMTMSGSSLVNGTLGGKNTSVGACPDTLTSSASGGAAGSPGVTGGLKVITPPNYSTPPALSPAPPVGSSMQASGSCWATGNGCTNVTTGCPSGKCIALAPTSTSGYTYGDVQASGGTTVYLSAGTYNMNSLVFSGGSPLVISSGPVVLNLQGIKQLNSGNPYPASNPINYENTAIDLSGASVSNISGVPGNFEIVCCGTAPAPPNGSNPGQNYCPGINLSGGSGTDAVIYAPNAGITMSGGSAWYGAIIGNTFTDSGGAAIHYDTALQSTLPLGASGFTMTGFTWSKN